MFGKTDESPQDTILSPDIAPVETSPDEGERFDETGIDMEDLHAEREAIYQFSQEERDAWGGTTPSERLSSDLFREIQEARTALDASKADTTEHPSPPPSTATAPPPSPSHHEAFSHVSSDGDSVHMVDVGDKQVTTRTARAQAKVLLPPEVLEAFQLSSNSSELVGPKGPIFATAKLAGILAAK